MAEPEDVARLAKQLRDACSGRGGRSLPDLRSWVDGRPGDPADYINIGNANGKTALHFAAQSRDDGAVQYLVQLRADVNATTTQGQTALIFASSRGHAGNVRALLDAGAACRVRTATGLTAAGVVVSGQLPEECARALREREEEEAGEWLDFTADAQAAESLAVHLQRNPRLEGKGGVPPLVGEVLAERKQQSALAGKDSRQRAASRLQGGGGAPPALELPAELQPEHVMCYDTAAFPFASCIKGVLREDGDLAELHRTADGQRVLTKFARMPAASQLGPRDNIWNQRFHTAQHSDEDGHMQHFKSLVQEFLRLRVLPDLGTRRIAYQADVTFRCHLPQTGALGRPHRDEDYGHPWSEVNYWVPLCKVWGGNSLTAESACGLGDFHAFSADAGQAVRFWGNQVWHYTRANDTDSTRVSFDLRVIREEEWSPASFSYFRIGEYYSVLDVDGLVHPEVLADLKQRYNGPGPGHVRKPGPKCGPGGSLAGEPAPDEHR